MAGCKTERCEGRGDPTGCTAHYCYSSVYEETEMHDLLPVDDSIHEHFRKLHKEHAAEVRAALADSLVAADPSIVGKANCGCWYHAEEGVPCEHDIALAMQEKR